LRAAVVTCGAQGSLAFTLNECWTCPAFPVDVVDTTGAGDAFAGAVAFGIACRWEWPSVLRFAGAVAGISITRLGAQTALPTWAETIAFLKANP
jgi:sugar/nucleoside kinase (ribokinase family)